MKMVFRNAATNAVSGIQTRTARGLASFLVDGVLKVKELSELAGAAATVTWYDNFTGEQVDQVAITSGGGLSGVVAKVPYHYRLEITGLVNGAIIDAGIDGDV